MVDRELRLLLLRQVVVEKKGHREVTRRAQA